MDPSAFPYLLDDNGMLVLGQDGMPVRAGEGDRNILLAGLKLGSMVLNSGSHGHGSSSSHGSTPAGSSTHLSTGSSQKLVSQYVGAR